MKRQTIINHEGKSYQVSDEQPKNGDLVLTDGYGVWTFCNDAPAGSNAAYAPMPYWANAKTCKKLILI